MRAGGRCSCTLSALARQRAGMNEGDNSGSGDGRLPCLVVRNQRSNGAPAHVDMAVEAGAVGNDHLVRAQAAVYVCTRRKLDALACRDESSDGSLDDYSRRANVSRDMARRRHRDRSIAQENVAVELPLDAHVVVAGQFS
jgi:hypothetical protein